MVEGCDYGSEGCVFESRRVHCLNNKRLEHETLLKKDRWQDRILATSWPFLKTPLSDTTAAGRLHVRMTALTAANVPALLPETLFLASVCAPFPDNLRKFRSYNSLCVF